MTGIRTTTIAINTRSEVTVLKGGLLLKRRIPHTPSATAAKWHCAASIAVATGIALSP